MSFLYSLVDNVYMIAILLHEVFIGSYRVIPKTVMTVGFVMSSFWFIVFSRFSFLAHVERQWLLLPATLSALASLYLLSGLLLIGCSLLFGLGSHREEGALES